jgi:hypothetical protein
MRVSGVLLLLSACTMDPGPPPLQFVADERLASFRLVDVTPRIVPLRGGPVRLSWVGTAADAGSVFHVIVGESVSPAFDNIVAAIAPSPDGGAGQWSFRLPPRPAGTFDLSLIGEVIALDAGRLGALVNAVTYRSTVGTPHFTPLGPTNLGVPWRLRRLWIGGGGRLRRVVGVDAHRRSRGDRSAPRRRGAHRRARW